LALVLWLGGAGGPYSVALLAAIVAGAARLLAAVGDVVDARADRVPVVMAAAGVASLVAAGAAHVPLLALGPLACLGLELLGAGSTGMQSDTAVEQVEPVDAPLSRAA
jgi:hypothetical protein